MPVPRVRDLQSVDERKCKDVLTAIGDLGQLALEVANVRFEVAALPHLDDKKMVVVPLCLSADAYWVRNASDTSPKLWRKCGGRE